MTLTTKYSTALMKPSTKCASKRCHSTCIDADGKRVMKPHKARSCAVCGAWYCGACKNYMTTSKPCPDGSAARFLHNLRIVYPDDFATAAKESRKVYKCMSCRGAPREYMQF